MDNDEQRDFAEEEYNRQTMETFECEGHEGDPLGEDVYCDGTCQKVKHAAKLANDVPDDILDDLLEPDIRPEWETPIYSNKRTQWGLMNESAQEVEDRTIPDDSSLPVGYGDRWDGSSTNQTNEFFIGHNGYVTTLWQVTNNPMEKYDPKHSYLLPALDGSALYVWCNLEFDDLRAEESIKATRKLLFQIDTKGPVRTIRL